MKRHILLVGLPGSGKSTVGRRVARTLGARFVDVDASVVARAGTPLVRIFGEQGEAAFRSIERDEVLRELAGEPGVIAPGGGWAAQVTNLEAAADHLTVYLKVTAEEAARRVAEDGVVRPLLSGPAPLLGALERLLDAREGFYARCRVSVETAGREPDEVVADVVNLARSLGGW